MIIRPITQEVNKSIRQKQQHQWQRKEQPLYIFILVMLVQIYTTTEVYLLLYLFNLQNRIRLPFVLILWSSIVRIAVFIFSSSIMTNLGGIFYAYTLLDMLGVLTICTGAVFIGFQLSFTVSFGVSKNYIYIICYILSFIVYIFQSGNFRVMMATCKWQKWKALLYKLKIYLSCIFIVVVGIYLTFNKLNNDDCQSCYEPILNIKNPFCQNYCTQVGKVSDCCYDRDNFLKKAFSIINDFYIIFLAAALASTSEMVAAMSQKDGSNQFKVHYSVGLVEEDQISKQMIEKLLKFSNIKDNQQLKDMSRNTAYTKNLDHSQKQLVTSNRLLSK